MWIKKMGVALAALAMFAMQSVAYAAGPTIRVGVQQFGTVNWELQSLKNAGFDEKNGINLEIIPFASGDATEIALQGGSIDMMVSDWLWVSRMRSENVAVSMIRYSSSVGSLMVQGDSKIKTLADVRGLKIGVAGGPLDKSWLLLQGMALKEHGLDLAKENEIVYGAPPLLAEKTESGELDATLNYWHFCARLEAKGMRSVVSIEDAAMMLGAKGSLSSLGYVFNNAWAEANSAALVGFIKASKQTKQLLKESDEQWVKLGELGLIKDEPAARDILRDHYRKGIPNRPLHDEIRDAEVIYQVLAKAGGEKLVGGSAVLVEGTFWEGAGSAEE